MSFRARLITACLLVAICGLISFSGAAQAQRPQVDLRTVYLQDPIDRAHQIVIRGELGGEGTVRLDGNTCTITQFGDPGVCTEIAFPAIPVKIVQLRLADSTGAGRRIFELRGELKPKDAKFFLIVPRRHSGAHRLVVNLDNDRRRVVTLEGLAVASPKPELCKNAKYRAVQKDGKVTLFATGEHPTSGWKVAFEQLPIEIFPPQYRLVCLQPTGIVAQVVTPFEVSRSFKASDPVKQVVVHDAKGKHEVPVKQE
jgi:hypothetical protein